MAERARARAKGAHDEAERLIQHAFDNNISIYIPKMSNGIEFGKCVGYVLGRRWMRACVMRPLSARVSMFWQRHSICGRQTHAPRAAKECGKAKWIRKHKNAFAIARRPVSVLALFLFIGRWECSLHGRQTHTMPPPESHYTPPSSFNTPFLFGLSNSVYSSHIYLRNDLRIKWNAAASLRFAFSDSHKAGPRTAETDSGKTAAEQRQRPKMPTKRYWESKIIRNVIT